MCFRLAQKAMTLDDLEHQNRDFVEFFFAISGCNSLGLLVSLVTISRLNPIIESPNLWWSLVMVGQSP